MIATVIDEADAAVIAGLIDGMEVLQIGCRQGFDTAALARSARRVVTIAQRTDLDHAGFSGPGGMWQVIMRFYAVADHALLLPGDPWALLAAFTPDQFDAVVVDVDALTGPVSDTLLRMISVVTSRVIMVPGRNGQWNTWGPAMAQLGYTVAQYGRVFVFEPATAAETEKNEDED